MENTEIKQPVNIFFMFNEKETNFSESQTNNIIENLIKIVPKDVKTTEYQTIHIDNDFFKITFLNEFHKDESQILLFSVTKLS